MAPRDRPVTLPSFPGVAIRHFELADGYEFGKRRRNSVDVVHRKTKDTTATIKCVCNDLGGSCTLRVTGDVAECVIGTCRKCTFEVTVPGQVFVAYLGDVFRK